MPKREDSYSPDYWEHFYASGPAPDLHPPSQFATFVIGEVDSDALIIDLGCGTGRDALFFSSYRHPVIGIDLSWSAVEACAAAARNLNLRATFLQASVLEPSLAERIQLVPVFADFRTVVVYARFFLHAIQESAEDAIFSLTRALSATHSTKLAMEFRTQRDATMPKTTSEHYRRFIDPVDVVQKATRLGFRTDYFVEGFGFAKRRLDDAHVARFLFSL